MSSTLLLILMGVLLVVAHKNGLTASTSDSVFGGVCGGLSRKTGLAPQLVRVLTVLFALLTGGFAVLLYILLWITLPKR